MAHAQPKRPPVPVFIATTVMLSFISFWRAAAIVLSDLASSAYYAGGDAEKVIGKSAPRFILAVMLFSYAVRAVYIEASSHVCARWRLPCGSTGHVSPAASWASFPDPVERYAPPMIVTSVLWRVSFQPFWWSDCHFQRIPRIRLVHSAHVDHKRRVGAFGP